MTHSESMLSKCLVV